MASFFLTFSATLLLISLISNTLLASKSREKGLTLTAPLLHWSSPESPYYRPNATPEELIQASVRASRARSQHINNILSGNYSGKWPISPVSFADGEFVMKFSVGTPPVNTYALPDTASHLVWLQCGSPCTSCYKQRIPYFDPTKSTTYKQLICRDPDCIAALLNHKNLCKYALNKCDYYMQYVDGSYSIGVVSQDVFTFADDIGGNFTINGGVFGCGSNNSSPFSGYNTPGVVGLNSEPTSLVSQMTLGASKLFSYCIARDRQKSSAKIQIQFGVTASFEDGADFTPLAPNNKGLYIFRDVDGLYSDGVKIDGPDWVFQYTDGGLGGVLMDTGMSYSMFYDVIVDNLVKVSKNQIDAISLIDFSDYHFSLCYTIEQWMTAGLPDIEFRFKKSTTTYPLMIENVWHNNGQGLMCLAIHKTNTISVIGLTQQRGLKIAYNLDDNTVGFLVTNDCVPY